MRFKNFYAFIEWNVKVGICQLIVRRIVVAMLVKVAVCEWLLLLLNIVMKIRDALQIRGNACDSSQLIRIVVDSLKKTAILGDSLLGLVLHTRLLPTAATTCRLQFLN